MITPTWLHFFQRRFPSANMVLIRGERPILFDTGFGSDAAETERLLREAAAPPESLALVVNSHYHGDHVGGNAHLQARYGLPIAAHAWDAASVNRGEWEVGDADWLDQPIEPYSVSQALHEGDTVSTGSITLQALHTPGHTLGHIALYEPHEQVLLCGDAVHGDDVAWLNPFRQGAGALDRAIETMERLVKLPVRWAGSGHGAAISDPPAAFARALARYQSWRAAPEKLAWHACKRIFAYALMLTDGMAAPDILPYLLGCPWYFDYARWIFRVDAASFVPDLLAEMARSGAARWQDDRLMPGAAYTPPPPNWPALAMRPHDWPRGN